MLAQRTLRAARPHPRPRKTTRPDISLDKPRKWNRPLAKGVLPAYDQALNLIKNDSTRLKSEAEELRAALTKADGEHALNALRDKLAIVEVQSEINLPEVRWMCNNGMADLSKPVYRHLLEQRWRKEGTLDLLMERIHQMNVVPDVLPSLHPSVDLRVTFPTPSRPRRKCRYQQVEPGTYLLPEQTVNPPRLYANAFHTDTRLYMLLMVDPDVPDELNQSYQTYLHWLQPNISLSSITSGRILPNSHTPYVPPHPQRGTPYHRYVILLLPQQSLIESIPILKEADRLGFDVRGFMDKHGLDGAVGGGAHMWREVWDGTVSDIYRNMLNTEEPKFLRPSKSNRGRLQRSTE